MSRDAIAERAVELVRAGAERESAASELVNLAGGRRGPIEEAHREFVMRLHRRSDDFEATKALRLVERALERVPWEATGYPYAATRVPQSATQPSPGAAARTGKRRFRLRRLLGRWRPAWGA